MPGTAPETSDGAAVRVAVVGSATIRSPGGAAAGRTASAPTGVQQRMKGPREGEAAPGHGGRLYTLPPWSRRTFTPREANDRSLCGGPDAQRPLDPGGDGSQGPRALCD